MSKAHHDDLWYSYWTRKGGMCLICNRRRGVVFHHFALVGASLYVGLRPRRHSTYNAHLVCEACHRLLHDERGEERLLADHLGSREALYRVVTARLHEYIDYLRGSVELHAR